MRWISRFLGILAGENIEALMFKVATGMTIVIDRD